MDAFSSLATFFKGGGPFMYIILAVGVFILAISVERFIVIQRAAGTNVKRFLDDLTTKLQRGDAEGARVLCNKMKSPAGEVALAICTTPTRDDEKLQNAADGAATLVLPPLTRRLPHLNTLANVATLLGLLGTIFGLTTAFSAVGAADPAQRSAFLAAGISQALSTTAFGLIVAVPALLMHGYLVGRVEMVVEHVDEVGVKLVRLLGRPTSDTKRAA
jgi:biopolymer transport protein ExbB/TolQ